MVLHIYLFLSYKFSCVWKALAPFAEVTDSPAIFHSQFIVQSIGHAKSLAVWETKWGRMHTALFTCSDTNIIQPVGRKVQKWKTNCIRSPFHAESQICPEELSLIQTEDANSLDLDIGTIEYTNCWPILIISASAYKLISFLLNSSTRRCMLAGKL